MDFPFLYQNPQKSAKSLVRKLTHSGDEDLNKEDLRELKNICKVCGDEMMHTVHKEYMRCLRKEHAQVRVSCVKLIDYLFQKSHIIRQKLLNDFDTFLELSLAISQRPKIKLKLPPPKKHAALLQELTSKLIHTWHADFGEGYEKLRYAHRHLREHRLVDFTSFRVQTHEDLIKQEKLAKHREKILTRSIENRLRELSSLEPDIEAVLSQINSLLDLLLPVQALAASEAVDPVRIQDSDQGIDGANPKLYGYVNLTQNVEIEFSPFVDVACNSENKLLIRNLKELKKELIDSKMIKLVAIEKTVSQRSEMLVPTIKRIVDLKAKCMNTVMKLSEMKIVNDDEGQSTKQVSDSSSESDADDFEEVQPKEGLEFYIPKKLRHDYGLDPIDASELDDSNKVTLTDESFSLDAAVASCSNSSSSSSKPEASSSTVKLALPCNARLESGKLCPRRDKVKCPFHGKIIPRDHNGIPVDEDDRKEEERRAKLRKPDVPDWQDPELLRQIKEATGVDLTMPVKGKRSAVSKKNKLVNTKTHDQTAKQRLQKRLRRLNK